MTVTGHQLEAPRCLVVAGEASGDLHAAAAIRALRGRASGAQVFGMGGDRLRAAGADIVFDAREAAVMGISEVIGKLPRLRGILKGLAQLARERRPTVALLVDLPDFNLRLARRLRDLGIPVIYYVSPMVWAWREHRCRALARDVRELLCIYPFEEPFLRARGVNARYVGNPLLDDPGAPPTPPVPGPSLRVALLPGSRPSEVSRLLAPMLEAVRLLSAKGAVEVAIPIAPTIDPAPVRAEVERRQLSARLETDTREVLRWSQVALVKSGTATLEACLAERPMVVVYRVAPLTALVGRWLLRVDQVSLVNILAGRRLVPELLQGDASPAAMAAAIQDVLGRTGELVQGYREVRAKLGGAGAAARVAEALLSASTGEAVAGA